MSKIIENPKTYKDVELTNTFFRPMLKGDTAIDLGIRVLYNMPMPTTINLWKAGSGALLPYAQGWNGSNDTERYQKTINMSKVKAEMSYAAADYFSMVYELITDKADVNLGDLSGTELEAAETELFRKTIAESIRATMWLGDTSRDGICSTFDGILTRLYKDAGTGENDVPKVVMPDMNVNGAANDIFEDVYEKASPELKQSINEGQLCLFVSGKVYENYMKSLLEGDLDSVRSAKINGISQLYYLGIPVINMGVDTYLKNIEDLPNDWVILTDRRNLVMALNTADFPGSQISMWYNEDELENRQRAIFMAGCDYLVPELVVLSHSSMLDK